MAQRQEMLTVSAEGFLAGSPASEALFKRAASYRSKRVHYQPGLYSSPWEKDDAAVRDISTSFKKQRTSFNGGLKQRALLDEDAAIVNESCEAWKGSGPTRRTRPKAKSKSKAATKARAKSTALGAAQGHVMATEASLHTSVPPRRKVVHASSNIARSVSK